MLPITTNRSCLRPFPSSLSSAAQPVYRDYLLEMSTRVSPSFKMLKVTKRSADLVTLKGQDAEASDRPIAHSLLMYGLHDQSLFWPQVVEVGYGRESAVFRHYSNARTMIPVKV
ncbi:hypothetical protein J6590_024653 [Homalodisca vitripennis]|nr:hypothetical protein J6590_024653 [Homalodisca vitripennis]